jgi:hypothetical protein
MTFAVFRLLPYPRCHAARPILADPFRALAVFIAVACRFLAVRKGLYRAAAKMQRRPNFGHAGRLLAEYYPALRISRHVRRGDSRAMGLP